MGLWLKITAGFLVFALIAGPLWPVAIGCLLYLAISLRPRRSALGKPEAPRSRAFRGYVPASFFFVLGALALALGGRLSPVALFIGGAVALLWPVDPYLLRTGALTPATDSVVLRSKYFPFAWHALAELKPGSESFPRSLSSFEGTLIIFTDRAQCYSLVSCFAVGQREAESKLLLQLRSEYLGRRSDAHPLPLDSKEAAGTLRRKLSRTNLPASDIVGGAPGVAGAVLLECRRGTVVKAGSFRVEEESRSPRLPRANQDVRGQPLTWEVLESLGKGTRWPDPDSFSVLLESLAATRGVHLGDRLHKMESSEGKVLVQGLAGGEVRVTRPQLRAIVSIYA